MADVIESLITILIDDSDLMELLGSEDAVGYMVVSQGTPLPNVIISDAANRIERQYGSQEDFRYVDIEAVAPLEMDGKSGYTATTEILGRIKELLDNNETSLTNGEGATICMRRGAKMPTRIDTQSGNEQYLRRGHEWEIVLSQ